MSSDFEDADFESLLPRVQRLLFGRLRTQVKQLGGITEQLTANCPTLGTEIYIGSREIRVAPGDNTGQSYIQADVFRRKWSVTSGPENPYPSEEPPVIWRGSQLVSETPGSDFHLKCEHFPAWAGCSCQSRTWSNLFEARI